MYLLIYWANLRVIQGHIEKSLGLFFILFLKLAVFAKASFINMIHYCIVTSDTLYCEEENANSK